MIRNWIIKLLGGVPQIEVNKLLADLTQAKRSGQAAWEQAQHERNTRDILQNNLAFRRTPK